MNCPKCSSGMYTYNTRETAPTTRKRMHVCIDCKKVFMSLEIMDTIAVRKSTKVMNKILARTEKKYCSLNGDY